MRLEDISIHSWINEYGIRQEKGELVDFKDHLFMFDPYTDFSPEQVTYKAAQIGYSVMAVLKTFYVAKKRGLDIIYTMPTDSDVSIFVGGKVNRIIAQNEILQSYTSDKDRIEQKAVGDSMIYYRGTFTKRAAISVTADLLVHDEEDFSDQEIIGDYDSRLQHSKYKWNWHFGHPSTIGVGVSKYWSDSDQKHWFVRCSHCNKLQYLNFPECICPERNIFVCKHCDKEITDNDRRTGQWVKKFKNKRYSGYWIPLMIAPWVSAQYILDKYKEHTEEYFYNRILGLPYIGSGNKVYERDITDNIVERVNSQKGQIIIGLDTGIKLHYTIGNEEGIFLYGEANSYSEIEGFLRRWKGSVLVADQGGDLIGIRELQQKYLGRVFLCHYRANRKTQDLITWGEGDEKYGTVVVDRNRVMQLLIDEFKAKKINIFGTKAQWWEYWLHWNNIYRVSEEDSLGVTKYKWNRAGADHWVHSTLYWRVGMDKFARREGALFAGKTVKVPAAPEVEFNTKGHCITYNPLDRDREFNLDDLMV